MHASRKLWTWLAVISVLSFSVLGWVGTEIFLNAPPIPPQVASSDGDSCFPKARSSTAKQPNCRPAASSSAPSGATAAILRLTGRPTGCTAKRCAQSGLKEYGKPFEALGAD